jgi:WD40 repeat protein
VSDSNVIAIVDSKSDTIQIWDRCLNRPYFSFAPPDRVKSMRLRPDVLLVMCVIDISVYNLFDSSQMALIPCTPNPYGAFDIVSAYGSARLAIPGPDSGMISVFDFLDPGTALVRFRAFEDGCIRAIEFSRNGELVGIASDQSSEIRIFSCRKGKLVMTLHLPSKRDGVKKMRFDQFTMLLMVNTEGRLMHLYQLPILNRHIDEKKCHGGKVAVTFSLNRNRAFWSFFGRKLFEINVVSEDFMLYALKYDSASKTLSKSEGVALQTPEMRWQSTAV